VLNETGHAGNKLRRKRLLKKLLNLNLMLSGLLYAISLTHQVEIWFSILARKVLKRGNFVSTEELRKQLEDFISYFNRTMGKPFKWTYKGKPLSI